MAFGGLYHCAKFGSNRCSRGSRPFDKKSNNRQFDRSSSFYTLLRDKTANIIKQRWNQFLLVLKATALKQQISKFYLEILSTEDSFCIYDRPLLNVLNVQIAT